MEIRFFLFEIIINALSVSFEYLCYGSTVIINILLLQSIPHCKCYTLARGQWYPLYYGHLIFSSWILEMINKYNKINNKGGAMALLKHDHYLN